jgi:hypothetical protein
VTSPTRDLDPMLRLGLAAIVAAERAQQRAQRTANTLLVVLACVSLLLGRYDVSLLIIAG